MTLSYSHKQSYDKVWRRFRGRCVICFGPANHVHEIVPRSLRPGDWWEEENRVPLCAAHHDEVHTQGTAKSEGRLRAARQRALNVLGR